MLRAADFPVGVAGMMYLKYIQSIVDALLDHDALVVIAPGLGLHALILAFLKTYLNVPTVSLSSATSSRTSGATTPVDGQDVDRVSPMHQFAAQGTRSPQKDVASTVPSVKSKVIIVLNTSAEEGDILVRRAMLEMQDPNVPVPHKEASTVVPPDQDDKASTDSSCSVSPQSVFVLMQGSNALSGTLADQRQSLYAKGGVFLIASRLLVTDMLTGRLPPEMVDGLIINHAHSVQGTAWNTAFAVNLYREKNKAGFIKAFSDAPEAFSRETSQLEHVLKTLTLRIVHLFPRFDATVEQTLSPESQPTTLEITPMVTDAMRDIQISVVNMIRKGLMHLKRLQQVDLSQLTLDECCFKKSWETRIQTLVDPIWGSLPKQYKRLIQDITIFRKLLLQLTRLDAIPFYNYVESLRVSDTIDERWFLTSEWDMLFKRAKQRIFVTTRLKSVSEGLQHKAGPSSESSIPGSLQLSLETPPKLAALIKGIPHLVSNIRSDVLANLQAAAPDCAKPSFRILIIARDYSSVDKVEQALLFGIENTKQALLRQFFQQEAERRSKSLVGITNRGPVTPWRHLDPQSFCSPTMSLQTLETVLILKKAQETDCLTLNRSVAPHLTSEANAEEFNAAINRRWSSLPVFLQIRVIMLPETYELEFLLRQFNPHAIISLFPHIAMIRALETYCAERYYGLVGKNQNDDQQRRIKVEVDSDTAPVNTVVPESQSTEENVAEAVSSCLVGPNIQVYLYVFRNTVDQQQFLYSLQTENQIWTSLIQQRRFLVVRLNEAVVMEPSVISDLVGDVHRVQKSSRQGGGLLRKRMRLQRDNVLRPTIVVDTREFRSALPFHIYRRNIRVVPVTLVVGDYVLSRDLCVERKSISDFVSSLGSGRLFDQVVEMTRHYADPMLLLEFKGKRAFSLESREWTSAIDQTGAASRVDFMTRFYVLVLTFPRLRIVWSYSSDFTATLFHALKEGREEPDPFRCALVGSSDVLLEQGNSTAAKSTRERTNGRAEDVVRRMPGVPGKTAPILLRSLKTLADLGIMDVDTLRPILGQSGATELYNFLDAEWCDPI